jgi:chromosome segregation ATPase
MKSKPTIIISFIILTAVALTQFGIRLNVYPPDSNITTASFIYHFSEIDTFDFNKEEFESEMEQLRAELEGLKNHKFEFEFDSEEFKEEMKQLAAELKNLKIEDLNVELNFDSGEFKKNMEELRDQQFTFQDFEFDMSKFKEEMKELKEEMKNFKIDFKDLNIKMGKLNGFLKNLKIEMKKDNLIDDENEDINLELNENEMKINGELVPDDLFTKYKKLYKKHFGKDPEENTRFLIN